MTRIRNTDAFDDIFAGSGNDVFFIAPGDSGDGDDRYFDPGGDDRVFGGDGNDILGTGTGDDTAFGGVGDDFLNVAGQAGSSAGRNKLFGGAGNDFLQLEEGGKAEGGSGNDTIIVSQGLVTATGGAGRDILRLGGYAQGLEVNLGPGLFIVASTSGNVVISGFEDVSGTFDSDVLIGSRRGNFIDGNAGDDRIFGKSGADSLLGNDGDDQLFGGKGADRIGHDLAEVSTRPDGHDTFTGGAGRDVFVFASGKQSPIATADVIADFRRGVDKIDLSDFFDPEFNLMTWEFIGTDNFTDGNQLRFADGMLVGSFDVGTDQPFAIRLTAITAISANDLILT